METLSIEVESFGKGSVNGTLKRAMILVNGKNYFAYVSQVSYWKDRKRARMLCKHVGNCVSSRVVREKAQRMGEYFSALLQGSYKRFHNLTW